MMKRVLRLVFYIIVKRRRGRDAMILSGRERENYNENPKTQNAPPRDRENVSKTKETRERKMYALTRTRCAPGTTLAEAVVGPHQSSFFLNFYAFSLPR
jgi:hypothetical protein